MNVSSVKNLNGEVFSAVQDASLTNVVHTNSGNWQDITAYQSNSASYLTAHQDLSDYYTTAEAETLSSMLSGAIDYVSANAGDEFPVSADEAIQYVQTNSGTIDDTVTSYQTNSGTFLTAHQAISADEWNDCYDNVNTNSGAWGGDALPITGRDGIDLEIDNGTLYIGASALTGQGGNPEVENYVQTNSANIDETVGCVQTNSASWGVGGSGITGVSHDNTLSGTGTTASPLGVVPGYNETVLYSGNLTGNGSTAQLSESIQNFEKIKVYGHTDDGLQCPWFTEFYPTETTMDIGAASNNAGWGKWFNFTITTGGLYTNVTGRVITFGSTTWGNLTNWGTTKVIGINRK